MLNIVESVDVVFDVLGHFCATNITLAEIAQEIPKTELHGDLVGVRCLTEMLTDEGVIGII